MPYSSTVGTKGKEMRQNLTSEIETRVNCSRCMLVGRGKEERDLSEINSKLTFKV